MRPAFDSRGVGFGSTLLRALAIALVGAAMAEGQGIRVGVSGNPISLQDRVLMQVTVEGARAAQPLLPKLEDFRVLEAGQSSAVNIVNGVASSSVTFSYYLYPKRAGQFEIGPATVDIGGKVYRSKPFTLQVTEEAAVSSQSRDYFLTAAISEEEPYVGQQVIYTWRFYRRLHVEVGEARLTSLDFGDMLTEDLGEPRQYSSTLNGVEYTVSEIKKAVFPQRAGEATIPASELVCQVARPGRSRRRSIFDLGRTPMEQKVLRTKPMTLNVRMLPAAPNGFSGLVGEFDLDAAVTKASLRVGESTSLNVTVAGSGNVQMLNSPKLPELPSFKVYDDQPTSKIERLATGMTGRKTYRRALVPLIAGEHEIPPLELVYFDPEAGSYRKAETARIRLDIAPSETREDLMLTESVAPTTGKVAVRVLADDILPIHRGLDSLRGGPLTGAETIVWGGAAAAPPLVFVGFLLLRRRQRRFDRDQGLRRRQVALREALRKVKNIESDKVARYDTETLAREASLCMRCYVGDKLGAAGSVLTPAEVELLLKRGGGDDGTVRRARELLERLEASQYGAAASTAIDRDQLLRSLEHLLKDLDRQLAR